jgi:site-specific DNA-methyltransferase (adenine-specific)
MGLALRLGGFEIRDCLAWIQGQGMPKSMDLGNGHGTGLKPGYEPILLVRKPLDGTTRGNYAAHGTGGIGIDACRTPYGSQEDRERMSASVEATRARGGLGSGWKNKSNLTNANPAHPLGRHPPNVIVDESAAEDLGEFSRYFYCPKASVGEKERGLGAFPLVNITGRAEGSPGRLNPRAGAGAGSDRRNPHPTIKPIALMRWLIRLVSIAPDGIVIDPFAGSGSTLLAARIEKINALGFEIDPSYVDVARARLEACG